LELLNKYYSRLDIPKVLELLPLNTQVTELYPVFQAVLRDNTSTRRNNQIIKNLLRSENLTIREQLIRLRSRFTKISEDRMCPVCNKRLGSSVFALYPNGVVVHFICCKNKTIDPITGQKITEE